MRNKNKKRRVFPKRFSRGLPQLNGSPRVLFLRKDDILLFYIYSFVIFLRFSIQILVAQFVSFAYTMGKIYKNNKIFQCITNSFMSDIDGFTVFHPIV